MAADVDVSGPLDEYEGILRAAGTLASCDEVMVILRRWQWDPDLDATCRQRARRLVREFHFRQHAAC